ncbi:CAP domain-containing protein [Nonomuraea turcica]|uniref:CAP domain-containing protein n=1 Tax=Nonomuraea sp. G32 TaxID=3067274 RepID=UPI00273BAC0D|nr:CAP domain-containing protein [Nonomuraea sp. G32]MDP4505978.1 CAP domain-containing protein [Nonomuraea sp. G32]
MPFSRKLATGLGVGAASLALVGVGLLAAVSVQTSAQDMASTATRQSASPPAAPGHYAGAEITPEPTTTRTPTRKATPRPTATRKPVAPKKPTAAPRPSKTTRSPSARSTSKPSTVGTTLENQVVTLANAQRAKAGCKPLQHDGKLRKAAYGHSQDMVAKDYFDHTSPTGKEADDRIAAAGFSPVSSWGENIAYGQRSAAAVMDDWMNSPGHKRNILDCSYTHIGVGYVASGSYWTQVFAAR